MLSNAAFNALLKTLEEPPQHVLFIMATTERYTTVIELNSEQAKRNLDELRRKVESWKSDLAEAREKKMGRSFIAAIRKELKDAEKELKKYDSEVARTIDTMNMNKDAWFDGQMPAPNPKSLSSLADAVVKGGYDLGIAMDGDGDRLGIIDRTGRYVSANEILCMLYDYLVRCKGWRGPVVRNVATTHMLDRIAESFGEKCHEVPVGFKHVSAKIDETDAVLGGESSGGLTVRGHIHGKDSTYAASLFAEMVSVTGKSPSELVDDLEARFGAFRMAEDAIRFEDADRKAAVERLLLEEKKLPSFDEEIERVGYEDGCKVYFKSGDWTLCRFSGTEPLLRVCAESPTEEKARSLVSAFRAFLGV